MRMLADEIIAKLDILPVETLRIHEQTVNENLRSLRETMLNLGRLVDPIIVDRKHRVVLDGNHRRQILEDLKMENAVCQMVDYDDPSIRIGGWYPASRTLDLMAQGPGERVDFDAGQAAVDRLEAGFMLVALKDGKRDCRLYPAQERKLRPVLAQQEAFVKKALAGGKAGAGGAHMMRDVEFAEDSRLDYFLDEGYQVMVRRNFTKDEIVAEALAGRPLPPKSTRHMIPGRIVRLNFHLGYLNEPIDVSKAQLDDMVRKRVMYGSARYYTEPVVVLY